MYSHPYTKAIADMSSSLIRQKYRSLGRLVNRLPEPKAGSSSSALCPEQSWEDLRSAFRKPLSETESLEDRLKEADKKVSFLRMVTPKSANESTGGRWIYGSSKSGNRKGTKVHTNWDGKNLDPCSVKQHKYQLKRMGFRNNAHAKGIF